MGGLFVVLVAYVNVQGSYQMESRHMLGFQQAVKGAYFSTGSYERVKYLNKRYVPKQVQFIAPNVFLIQQAIQEQRVTLRWEFP